MAKSSSTLREVPYTELNSEVLLFSRPDGRLNPRHPSVILLFGWMDARLTHLIKFVEHLHSAFDTSSIIVIKATSVFYFTSQRRLEATLVPAVDVIRNEMSERAQFRGVLVHVLSNGGGFQLTTLRKVLTKTTPRETVVPSVVAARTPIALVLDSAPGDNGLASAISFTTPPYPILRMLVIPPVALLYAIFYVINSLRGNPPIFEELRTSLNVLDLLPTVSDPRSSPGMVPRLYVYSDADKITIGENVARHAREAAAHGFNVAVEKYEGTSHVAHMRQDPDRYWGAVKKLWARALEQSQIRVSASL